LTHTFIASGDQGYLDRCCRQISICGKELILDPSGALYMPAIRALVISDLVEDGDGRRMKLRRRKVHHLSEKLALLDEVIGRFKPEKIVALGEAPIRRDDFEDLEGAIHEMFFSYFDHYEWHWVGPGNDQDRDRHDNHQGTAHETLGANGLMLRYRPLAGPVTHEISGHVNPAAFIGAPDYAIRRPCFVSNGMRLVMPRFGSYRGGENILDDRFRTIFTDAGLNVWMLGYDGVQPVACRQLRAD